MVSAVLPPKSRYASVSSSRTARVPERPLGETLTWPSSASGAVAAKKTGWLSMNSRSLPSIRS